MDDGALRLRGELVVQARGDTVEGADTYDSSSTSSVSASTSVARATNDASSGANGANAAWRVPGSRTVPMGTIAGVNRSVIARSTPSWRAPGRSILLTKIRIGTCSRCSARIKMRVCGCTPSTAETTSTAPSSTPSDRSTSAMKSGCPGVSMRFAVTSPIVNDTTAALIVMPRCCSSASESVCVVPLSTLPTSSMTPAA